MNRKARFKVVGPICGQRKPSISGTRTGGESWLVLDTAFSYRLIREFQSEERRGAYGRGTLGPTGAKHAAHELARRLNHEDRAHLKQAAA